MHSLISSPSVLYISLKNKIKFQLAYVSSKIVIKKKKKKLKQNEKVSLVCNNNRIHLIISQLF